MERNRCLRLMLVSVFLSMSIGVSLPAGAQYGGYGGAYDDTSSTSSPEPEATPTPSVPGQLNLSISYQAKDGSSRYFPAEVAPGGVLQISAYLSATGYLPGEYSLAAMVLNIGSGSIGPTRKTMNGSGEWVLHFKAGSIEQSCQLLFTARDRLRNHRAAAVRATVQIMEGKPLLIFGESQLSPDINTARLRLAHRSWMEAIQNRSFMNSGRRESLERNIASSRDWRAAIQQAVKIDRDRLNISGKLPAKNGEKSYLDIQPLISRYWADTGISLSTATANEIGDVFIKWRASPELVINTSPRLGGALRINTGPIKIGRVLNAVGGVMIMLDFWSNMTAAETPVEAREAWYKAGYASLDLYLANIIGKTFTSAAALPGMWVSYILNSSYDTLIGGYKSCWFKKFVTQAVDADYLAEDIHNTAAIEKVKAAMLSPVGLKGKLSRWWDLESGNWAGKMGGCGNWDLARSRGYKKAFIDNLMKSPEFEVNGKRYHPWSFYYSVSRMIVLDKKKQMAHEAAEELRKLEAAYLTKLDEEIYQGQFRLVSSSNENPPLRNMAICLDQDYQQWNCYGGWTTDQKGNFTVRLKGTDFSPNGIALLAGRMNGKDYVFRIPQRIFEKVTP